MKGGYLGKRANPLNTEVFSDAHQLDARLNDKSIKVKEVRLMANDELVALSWKREKEPMCVTQSVVHAALITSIGRIQMYRLIDKYQNEV